MVVYGITYDSNTKSVHDIIVRHIIVYLIDKFISQVFFYWNNLGIVWENLGKHFYNLRNNNLFIINEN